MPRDALTAAARGSETLWSAALAALGAFFLDVLDHDDPVAGEAAAALAEPGSAPGALTRVLQACLAAAVQCQHKDRYISGIMALEKQLQSDLMLAINEIMEAGDEGEEEAEEDEEEDDEGDDAPAASAAARPQAQSHVGSSFAAGATASAAASPPDEMHSPCGAR